MAGDLIIVVVILRNYLPADYPKAIRHESICVRFLQ